MNLIISFITRQRVWIARIVIGVILASLGVYTSCEAQRPAVITQVLPTTQVIEVPVEKLTVKNVTQYVEVVDRVQVNRLLRENQKLNITVQQLMLSQAQYTSSGGGLIDHIVPPPSDPTVLPTEPSVLPAPVGVSFTDWRLHFQSDGVTANYTLTQKFSITATVGVNKYNKPVNIINLYELGAQNERVAIPITNTTIISASDTLRPRFYRKATLQAGIGVTPSLKTDPVSKVNMNVTVAVPWLKRGRTTAVEDTRYAYFTPAVNVNTSGGGTVIGALPISFNVGTIGRNPFTDVWVSPFVGIASDTSKKHWGIVLSATF